VPKPPLALCSDGSKDGKGDGQRKYSPAKWAPEPTQKFFIYTGGPFEYLHLLPCYKEKYKVDLWKDERMWELAQNAGALWVKKGDETLPP
jgi:hypothetical protein